MIWRLHKGLGIPAESLIKVDRSGQLEGRAALVAKNARLADYGRSLSARKGACPKIRTDDPAVRHDGVAAGPNGNFEIGSNKRWQLNTVIIAALVALVWMASKASAAHCGTTAAGWRAIPLWA